MSSIAKTLGIRIRNCRTSQKLSQEKLAELCGCHPTYIGQLERGEKNATVESVEKIARALEVPLWELLRFPEQKSGGEEDWAFRCYELAAAQKPEDQQRLYQILLEIQQYKRQ